MITDIIQSMKWRVTGLMERFFSKKSIFTRTKTLLIVRLDSIGDYVLFRNFIREIKNSSRFKYYKVTLCGNNDWKDLAYEFDRNCVDEFVWVDKKKFWESENKIYRYKKLLKLHFSGYEVLIQPNDSRTKYRDYIIRNSGAKYIIGDEADSMFLFSKDESEEKGRIDEQIAPSSESLFQFYRNKSFIESLTKEKSEIQKPYFENVTKKSKEDYIVMFPGAGNKRRKWSPDNYAEICRRIQSTESIKIVICGSKADKLSAENIIEKSGTKNIEDKTGQTSLPDLVNLISNARLLISNESCAVHIAAAVNVNAICISNGNHYGRFNPYPEEITKCIKTIYHPEIRNSSEEFDKIVKRYSKKSELDINSIVADEVFAEVEKKIFVTGIARPAGSINKLSFI